MAHLDALRGAIRDARCFMRRGGHGRARLARRKRAFIVGQGAAGVRGRVLHHLRRRADCDDLAARLAALGAEVDDPIAGADHVEVVLDHDQRMARGDELAERGEQPGHVLEMQPGGGLVEQEDARLRLARGAGLARAARQRGDRAAGGFGEVAGELEALRLPARERGDGLPQAQVVEAHVGERLQAARDLRIRRESRHRLAHGELEHLRDVAPVHRHLEHLVAVAGAVTVWAAQVYVGQELHLDVLEAVAAAGGAAAVARIEAEGSGRVAARSRVRRGGEERADRIERTHVARGIGARRAPDRRLVDEHHVVHPLDVGEAAECAGRLGGLAEVLQQRRMQHVLDERGLARSRHPGHAHQPVEREIGVDVLQVVLGRPAHAQAHRAAQRIAREVVGDFRAGPAHLDVGCARIGPLAPREVLAGEGVRVLDRRRGAEEDDLPAALARARPHVEQLVGLEHDLRVVLDHHEGIARVTQPLHHADDAPHVARVQPDRRLVEHEERVHQRSAERGGEVDALHLAAGQGARLAVEREVAEAHLAQVAQPRADLGEQQLGRLVERRGQRQAREELRGAIDRQQHRVVDRQSGQRRELAAAPFGALGQVAQPRGEHRVRIVLRADAPQQRLGLEARAFARGARGVGPVAREQHADVHLVRLGLEPGEEALHAVPVRLARLPPAHPVVVAADHPAALLRAERAPRRVERDAAFGRELLELVLAFVEALRLEDLDRARAQGLRLVGDHEPVVHADHAAEPAAGVARADRGVEREARRRGIGVVDVAVGAMQVGGKAPCLGAVLAHEDVHASCAHPQRRLDRLHHARLFRACHADAVLHHLEPLALAPVDARVALALQQLRDLFLGEVLRHVDGECDQQARIARGLRAARELGVDRLRSVAPHRLRAAPAREPARAREEQLQVIVDLGHRAHGRARGAHRVRLVDGDGRRNALDRVHLGLVHAVEELARVGREGLDIAPLALGIERVEDERGLAGAGRPRHHHQLARGNLDVEVLQVVLARPADADRVGRRVVQCGGVTGGGGGKVVHGGSLAAPEGTGRGAVADSIVGVKDRAPVPPHHTRQIGPIPS